MESEWFHCAISTPEKLVKNKKLKIAPDRFVAIKSFAFALLIA
jgi:hypothetical protein